MDFNLLKPDKSLGKYWAGIGLRYGLSRFTSEVPFLEKTELLGNNNITSYLKEQTGDISLKYLPESGLKFSIISA